MPVWLLRPRGRGDFIRQRAGGERRKLMCHSRWFLCFPSTWSQTGRREEMIYAHKGKRRGERGRVRGRERKISQKAPGAWNVFLLVKTLLSWFFLFLSFFFFLLLLWLEVLELFSIRKAFLFVIKNWKWKYIPSKKKKKKSTNRHNNVMQFFFSPHYLHTVIQPMRRCPAALLRACFTMGAFSYSLLCNLEDVILWPASFINNCTSPVNCLKSTYNWWQHTRCVGG